MKTQQPQRVYRILWGIPVWGSRVAWGSTRKAAVGAHRKHKTRQGISPEASRNFIRQLSRDLQGCFFTLKNHNRRIDCSIQSFPTSGKTFHRVRHGFSLENQRVIGSVELFDRLPDHFLIDFRITF